MTLEKVLIRNWNSLLFHSQVLFQWQQANVKIMLVDQLSHFFSPLEWMSIDFLVMYVVFSLKFSIRKCLAIKNLLNRSTISSAWLQVTQFSLSITPLSSAISCFPAVKGLWLLNYDWITWKFSKYRWNCICHFSISVHCLGPNAHDVSADSPGYNTRPSLQRLHQYLFDWQISPYSWPLLIGLPNCMVTLH